MSGRGAQAYWTFASAAAGPWRAKILPDFNECRVLLQALSIPYLTCRSVTSTLSRYSGFQTRPQIPWHSSLQKVGPNSPPPEGGSDLVVPF